MTSIFQMGKPRLSDIISGHTAGGRQSQDLGLADSQSPCHWETLRFFPRTAGGQHWCSLKYELGPPVFCPFKSVRVLESPQSAICFLAVDSPSLRPPESPSFGSSPLGLWVELATLQSWVLDPWWPQPSAERRVEFLAPSFWLLSSTALKRFCRDLTG